VPRSESIAFAALGWWIAWATLERLRNRECLKRKLGELLEGSGHISAQDARAGHRGAKIQADAFGEVLFENSLVEKEALVAALTEVMAIAYVDCENAKPDPAALQLLPSKIADRYNVLPLRLSKGASWSS